MTTELIQAYHNDQTVRHSVQALGALTSCAAGLYWGTRHVQILIGSVAILSLGKALFKARQTLHSDRQEPFVSELFHSVFTIVLIGGVALAGLNLADLMRQGGKLFTSMGSREPYRAIKALRHLGSLGSTWIPLALFCLRQSENYFYRGSDAAVHAFALKTIDAWLTNSLGDLLSESIKPYFEFDDLEKVEEYRKIFGSCQSLRELQAHQIAKLFYLYLSERVPTFTRKTPTPLDQARIHTNRAIFYSLTFLFTGSIIYYHPIPTTAAFLCGLVYPTQIQPRKHLTHTWTRVPDFFSFSFRKLSQRIERSSLLTLFALKFGYPFAFLHGLLLAESFRYFIWPHLSSTLKLPIEPLTFASKENRWHSYLNGSFEKISLVSDADPVYNSIKQKVISGMSARKILELDEPYTEEELKIAYRKCSLIAHPDKHSLKQEEASALFKCVARAKEILASRLEKNQAEARQSNAPSGSSAQEWSNPPRSSHKRSVDEPD